MLDTNEEKVESSNASNAINSLKLTLRANKNSKSIIYPSLGAVALATSSFANAGIIYNDSSFTVDGWEDSNVSEYVNWDIDGDSDIDITLWDSTQGCSDGDFFTLTSSGLGAGFLYNANPSGSSNNNNSDLAQDQLEVITAASVVGASGTFGHMACATHDNPCQNLGSTSQDFDLFPGATIGQDVTGLIGFMFDNNGATNYGIASFSLLGFNGTNPSGDFVINEWWYDDSGADIRGASAVRPTEVPEPGTLGIFLAGLALGCAGMRRRKSLK